MKILEKLRLRLYVLPSKLKCNCIFLGQLKIIFGLKTSDFENLILVTALSTRQSDYFYFDNSTLKVEEIYKFVSLSKLLLSSKQRIVNKVEQIIRIVVVSTATKQKQTNWVEIIFGGLAISVSTDFEWNVHFQREITSQLNRTPLETR